MDEIQEIKERNRRVELDKAWETSYMRRGIIMILTYIVASVWLIKIGNAEPFLNAVIPSGGYLFSTWSLPFIKSWWVARQKHD